LARARACRPSTPFGARARVSTVEQQMGGDSYTLRTVKTLMAEHPEHAFALVIGADLIGERQRWHGWAELSALVPFIVVGRQGQADVGGLALPPISSTEVRERIARGQPIEGWVDIDIIDYINANHLYRA
jgi:nicotinate-nucleotide adenylyltransferase